MSTKDLAVTPFSLDDGVSHLTGIVQRQFRRCLRWWYQQRRPCWACTEGAEEETWSGLANETIKLRECFFAGRGRKRKLGASDGDFGRRIASAPDCFAVEITVQRLELSGNDQGLRFLKSKTSFNEHVDDRIPSEYGLYMCVEVQHKLLNINHAGFVVL
ncbi:unnamed protein product [Cuscuta epithymum]|uniref:Uncharacterized protein n=1 Tax=Cuscuta epithymum TaxID=186058 RepID=A0AAV0E3Z8_9ASTE|nr:unnamed protein product [Cuscuta epithymum]